MNKAFEKILERLILESSSCKVYKLIKPNIEDVAEFNAYKKCIEIVKEVAEEYNGGWIPCSERLPEPNQKVIVTYMDRYIGGSYGVCEGQYVYILNSWDISDYMSDDDFEVLAWQPLPEPYKDN